MMIFLGYILSSCSKTFSRSLSVMLLVCNSNALSADLISVRMYCYSQKTNVRSVIALVFFYVLKKIPFSYKVLRLH
jgi:hypothetical protein